MHKRNSQKNRHLNRDNKECAEARNRDEHCTKKMGVCAVDLCSNLSAPNSPDTLTAQSGSSHLRQFLGENPHYEIFSYCPCFKLHLIPVKAELPTRLNSKSAAWRTERGLGT